MTTESLEPIYPWDPPGCEACCSGEPFPNETLNAVTTVTLD